MNQQDLAMYDPQVIQQIKKEVQQILHSQGAGHGWDHIQRVYTTATDIQSVEGGELWTIELAALLHDVGDAKFHDGKERSGEISRDLLKRYNVSKEQTEPIVHIVENLSFRKRDTALPLTTEGQIVQDADRLDALGAVGIVRTIEYGQYRSQPFYDVANPLGKSGVIHFHEKLFRIPDLLNTQTAKAIAVERIEFMRSFLFQYFSEIGSPVPAWFSA